MFDGQAKERKVEAGKKTGRGKVVAILPPPIKARDAAGEALKVGGKTVDAATKVLESKNRKVSDE